MRLAPAVRAHPALYYRGRKRQSNELKSVIASWQQIAARMSRQLERDGSSWEHLAFIRASTLQLTRKSVVSDGVVFDTVFAALLRDMRNA
jgi:hypothetical protein